MEFSGWKLGLEYESILDITWEEAIAPVFEEYYAERNFTLTKNGKKQGRRRISDRVVFNTVLYVMLTGAIWNSVYPDKDGKLCRGNTAHKRYREWVKACLFERIYASVLAYFNSICPINCLWAGVDGTKVKAMLGGDCTGKNPTDLGRQGTKISLMVEYTYGLILALYFAGANVHDSKCLGPTLDAMIFEPKGSGEKNLCLDSAFIGKEEECTSRGFTPHICPRGEERKAKKLDPEHINRRWMNELLNAWLKTPRKVGRRFEKTIESYTGLCFLSAIMIALRTLFRRGLVTHPLYTTKWVKRVG